MDKSNVKWVKIMFTHDSKSNSQAQQPMSHNKQKVEQTSSVSNRNRISHILQLQSTIGNRAVNRMVNGNNTGLPDHLKTGLERLSGLDLSPVKVHYNSDKPAQLQAHAFAEQNEIHIAPGQEKYLPHEGWHVVQQMQGRVSPTTQEPNGKMINDDPTLEHEADIMGTKANDPSLSQHEITQLAANTSSYLQEHVLQRVDTDEQSDEFKSLFKKIEKGATTFGLYSWDGEFLTYDTSDKTELGTLRYKVHIHFFKTKCTFSDDEVTLKGSIVWNKTTSGPRKNDGVQERDDITITAENKYGRWTVTHTPESFEHKGTSSENVKLNDMLENGFVDALISAVLNGEIESDSDDE
ncbi:DUF4157 domain-containing protein [Brevibacillus sp. DP1.3A]|uniref:eCIS core domain-containing protein n=1 Tax=Brevibacillus sp. DP1.3A TaxID=2738867 RepID=UPI001C2BC253|nr:DUF4157 domain-containing protein [Brevibacillus sp. DP1.3A]UED73238.1 DUF4157 domain-containing protein [Brevibacillus sp. DP1.3A]